MSSVITSETPIDVNNLPTPKTVLSAEARSHTDTNIEIGKTYHVRVGSIKNEVEKLSDEHIVKAGVLWTPSALPTEMFYIADNVVYDSSNRISQLTDMSGKARHATQSTNSAKPLLSAFPDTQEKAISFDGVDDYFWQSNTSYLNGVSGVWCFSVDVSSVKTGYNYIFQSQYASSSGPKSAFGYVSGNVYAGGRRQVSNSWAEIRDSASSATQKNIIFSQLNYSEAKELIFRNGLNVATNNSFLTAGVADSSPLHGSSIGAYVSNNVASTFDGGFNGKTGCIIVGVGVLSASDRQKIEGWAAHKYGLTGNLPSDHPYKTLIPTL